MKTLKILVALSLFGLVIQPLSAQVELNKKRSKSFDDALNSTLVFNTEFADINLVNHTKSSIDINAEIRVKGEDKASAEKLLKNYDVILEKEGNEIRIETKTKNLINKGGSIEILINVKAPANIGLDMNAGYGDVNIAEIHGETNINVKYGSLKAAKLLHDGKDKPVKLNVQYCEPVTIGIVKNAELNLEYSKLKMTAAGVLKAHVKYAEAEFKNAVKLVVKGEYGSIQLGKISILQAEGKFSNFILNALKKRADIDMEYGGIVVSKILKSAESVDINAEYTTVSLAGLESTRLKGEARHTELQLPGWVNIDSSSFMEKTLSGGEGNTLINLEMKYGNLTITE